MKTKFDEMLELFLEFHRLNPLIYETFKIRAFVIINRGRKRYGAHTIYQSIRWEESLKTYGEDAFELNNNHVPFYSRLFMESHPEHDGLFEKRKQTSKDHPAKNPNELGPLEFNVKDYDNYPVFYYVENIIYSRRELIKARWTHKQINGLIK